MAERRMFAKKIVQSSRFLKMPVSSRELYFQMGMAADDDGVCEAWNVMKVTDAREDDLRVLVSRGYVQILDDEDMIAYLTDWESNNSIRADRYHEGAYKNLKLQVLELLDNQMTTNCQPSDNQMTTEVSIGKSSLDKSRIDKVSQGESKEKPTPTPKPKPTRHCYGEFKNVRLSDEELEKLKDRLPDWEKRINDLSYYIDSKGDKYKNHYSTILNWARKDKEKAAQQATPQKGRLDWIDEITEGG